MKKILLVCLTLLSILTMTSCFGLQEQDDSKDVFLINDVNWDNYCSVNTYFLGVRNGQIEATCWFSVDSNYEIYEDLYVELKVSYDAFYYTNLLGGDETHTNITYYYRGPVKDHKEELKADYYIPYEGTKEYFCNAQPVVTMIRISGKLCR